MGDVNKAFSQYLSSFDTDMTVPLEDHPDVEEQQKKFGQEISKFQMRHCVICTERWPMDCNLHVQLEEFKIHLCNLDTNVVNKFSIEDYMTLVSGAIEELHNCMDATTL